MNYDPFVKEDFILPEKWYCSYSNKEEFDIMNKFFKGNWGFVSIDGFNGCTNLSNCNHWFSRDKISDDIIKITFEQFKKYVLKEPIEQSKSIEKWSVGSYVVFLNSDIQSNGFNKGDIQQISEYNSLSIIYYSGVANTVSDKGISEQIKWFATKSEAEEFAKTLVEPVKHSNGILDAVDVKQPLKQVVHCKTQEEWGFVSNKIGYKFINKFELGNSDTINPVSKGCQSKSFFEGHEEYQILSFQEWCDLNEYKMEKEVKFEVGDYVILENAGGWSYSTFNDGCLGLITKIGNFKPSTVTDYICSISGNILNSNNKDTTFRDIPIAFYHRKWIVRHATPEEINQHLISIGQIPDLIKQESEKYPFKPLKPGDLEWEIQVPQIKTHGIMWCEPAPMTKDNWKNKMILSIDDEELPMVSIIKTNSIKQLLNND